jgi:hypothetical protein
MNQQDKTGIILNIQIVSREFYNQSKLSVPDFEPLTIRIALADLKIRKS